MSLISIDWTTVLITTLSTLVVGLIIARYGYKIWKEQFHYQKKVELYVEFEFYFNSLKVDLMNAYNGDFRNVNDKTVKIHREQIFPLKSKFVFYFGESYRKPIDDLLRLLYNIVSSDGTSMNKEQFKSYVKERVDKIESVKKQIK